MSAYLLVSLHSQILRNTEDKGINESTDPIVSKWSEHQWWDFGQGWKNLLNNLRLVMQPYQFFNLLKPWQASFFNYAFINWLFNANCLNESNARCYPREHLIQIFFIFFCLEWWKSASLMSKLQAPDKEATVRFSVDMSVFVHRKLSMLAMKTERKKVDRLCGCCWRMDWRRWMGKSDRSSPHHGSEEVLQILQIPDWPGNIVASPLSTRPIRAWTLHPEAKRMR